MKILRQVFLGFLLVFTSCAENSYEANTVESTSESARLLSDKVNFIYSANVFGELEPCGCRRNPTGGMDRKEVLLKKEGLDVVNSLQLDSGDLFFGSTPTPPFLKDQWNLQAHNIVKAYNLLGHDAFVPGELDFASGLETFKSLVREAKFAVVCANLYYGNKLLLKPYVILTKGGKKIGVFGLIGADSALPEELKVKSYLEAAEKIVKELRSQVDLIIAITHIGLEGDTELAQKVSGIDAIFGGHSQSFLQTPLRVGSTMIFQTSFRNQHIGIYQGTTNRLIALDTDYSPNAKTAITELHVKNKSDIEALNKKNTENLFVEQIPTKKEYQTAIRCAQCHEAQYEFHKKTDHSKAYMTLVQKKQNHNKDCLQCHTLAMGEPEGWQLTKELVWNARTRPVNPEDFAKSLPRTTTENLGRYSKSFINVQCEHCHGSGNEHPFSNQAFPKITPQTCVKCHTEAQAPAWYKSGALNTSFV